jgi:hypothetical protein
MRILAQHPADQLQCMDHYDLMSLFVSQNSICRGSLAGANWEWEGETLTVRLRGNGKKDVAECVPFVCAMLRERFGVQVTVNIVPGQELSGNALFEALEKMRADTISTLPVGAVAEQKSAAPAAPEAIFAPQALPQVTVTFDGGNTADSVYAPEFLEKKDQYAYFFGGNWGRVDIDTGVDNGKHIVIIKDSFANAFVPYLLGEYAHITMLDLRYFAGNVQQTVADTGADEVLFLYEMTNLLSDTGILKLAR